MQGRSIVLGVLTVTLACAGSARAGVYSTAEPAFKIDEVFPNFQNHTLIPLKRVGTVEADRGWVECYSMMGEALKRNKSAPVGEDDPFTMEDRLNMSACLMRMRDPQGAIAALLPLQQQDPNNFLAMSQRGTAYFLAGDYRTAYDWLVNARPFWNKSFADLKHERRGARPYILFLEKRLGWDEKQFNWYARCEKYQLRLAKLRYFETETLKRAKKEFDFARALEELDDLLVDPDKQPPPPGPRFVDPSGKFEPGKIAAEEKAKIPHDAMLVTKQLLVWMPEDRRLIWLFAELLNAEGDYDAAKRVLGEFASQFAQREEFKGFGQTPNADALFPKFVERHPVVGQRLKALKDYNGPLLKEPVEDTKKTQSNAPQTKPPPKEEPTVNVVNIDWQTLGVGFGSGALVGILSAWWLLGVLRRRHARGAALAVPAGAGWQPPTAAGTSNIQAENR